MAPVCRFLGVLGLAASLSACQDANKIALKVGAPPPNAAQLRTVETKQIEGFDAPTLLTSATATLQDLGYIITESAPQAGVLVASKQRDAQEVGQVAGQILLTVAMAAFGVLNDPTWDKSQAIHVTVVVSSAEHAAAKSIRVSFDRYVMNNHGVLWRTELITDPKIYNEFYIHLNQSLSSEKRA